MRLRTILPAAALIGAAVLATTACEAGIEDKDKASGSKPATTSAQTANPGTGTGQGAGTPPQTSATTSGGSSAPASGTPTNPKQTPATASGGASSPVRPTGTGPIVISATGQQAPVDCTGRDVRIEGEGANINFTGTCGTLTITGDDNSVETSWFDKISVSGSNNLVLYGVKADGTTPAIEKTGTSNQILTR